MEWINFFGLIIMIIIMIPNIIFAWRCKDGFDNKWKNKTLETFEQIGRFGCFGLMIFHVPGICLGFASHLDFVIYMIVDSFLVFLYCLIWILYFHKKSVFRALALSIIPSLLFLVSGIFNRCLLLIVMAIIFSVSHIILSYKNAI